MKNAPQKMNLFAISLLVLSACSSAPKQESAQLEKPITVEELLTERVIAQITAVDRAGVQGLMRVLNSAVGEAAKAEVRTAIKQVARELGIAYTSIAKLSDDQANQILNKLFYSNASLRSKYINSSDESLGAIAKRQEANVKVKSDVDLNGSDVRVIAKHLYDGFGNSPHRRELINSYMKYKHYTGGDLMTTETCGTVQKLDQEAGKNAAEHFAIQANLSEELAQANRGLSKAKLSECALNQGAIRTIVYFNETLGHSMETLPTVISTAETACSLVRKGTAAQVARLLQSKPTIAQIKSLQAHSCN